MHTDSGSFDVQSVVYAEDGFRHKPPIRAFTNSLYNSLHGIVILLVAMRTEGREFDTHAWQLYTFIIHYFFIIFSRDILIYLVFNGYHFSFFPFCFVFNYFILYSYTGTQKKVCMCLSLIFWYLFKLNISTFGIKMCINLFLM